MKKEVIHKENKGCENNMYVKIMGTYDKDQTV